jgi:hypothetical protein
VNAAAMLIETCKVLRRSTPSTDAHGHPVWKWDNVGTEKCRWWEDSQKILTVEQEAAVTTNSVALLPNTQVIVTDRLYINAKTYEIRAMTDWRGQAGELGFKIAACMAVE